MRVVIDIEANGLHNPTQIWLIVCKDIDTGERYIFRNVTTNAKELGRFLEFHKQVDLWIGHNVLSYDAKVIRDLLGDVYSISASMALDTLIISKLVDYSRAGHSIEDYGIEFGIPKGIPIGDEVLEAKHLPVWFYSKWSQDLEDYCIRDVDICEKIYGKYLKYTSDPKRLVSIRMEHEFQILVNQLEQNGFAFNARKARQLLESVERELATLDKDILREFPPREITVREFTPKATKFGTISKSSVPRALHDRIHEFEVGRTYPLTRLEEFNPASHKQIIRVLNEAGWKPTDKTQARIDAERELNRLKYSRERNNELDLRLKLLEDKLKLAEVTGWKINETNLSTLPPSAPSPARTLAKRILLESRRRTLTEWLGLCDPDTSRIHGSFYGIGAWTHRMAHQKPNTANIPREFTEDGSVKLLGKEMRQLWQAPRNRLLVGVDAEGIQLRIFAHYIDDKEFTEALVNGKKSDKTDPHSLNQRVLGPACRTRQAAKRFIYALLLGAGIDKLAAILGCDKREAEEALDRLLERYTGFGELKRNVIPSDAKRGWFEGLDGRAVKIPGDTVGARKHLCMSGYLQNGEAVVMKMAALKWHPLLKDFNAKFVNMVHDEWQTEVPNNMEIAVTIAKAQAQSLVEVGEELKLKCPLAGSYWSEDLNDYTIGTNWYTTH